MWSSCCNSESPGKRACFLTISAALESYNIKMGRPWQSQNSVKSKKAREELEAQYSEFSSDNTRTVENWSLLLLKQKHLVECLSNVSFKCDPWQDACEFFCLMWDKLYFCFCLTDCDQVWQFIMLLYFAQEVERRLHI